MVGCCLAALALLGFAGRSWADKTVDCVILGVLWFDVLAGRIFFGSVFGIALLELEFSLALAAFSQIAHFADGLVLEGFETLVPEESFELILHHDGGAAGFEAVEIAHLIDEFSVDVFVDARHAEDMPAVVDVEENFSIKVFIVFSVAVGTLDHLGFVHVDLTVPVRLLHDLCSHRDRFRPIFGVELPEDFAEGPFFFGVTMVVRAAECYEFI